MFCHLVHGLYGRNAIDFECRGLTYQYAPVRRAVQRWCWAGQRPVAGLCFIRAEGGLAAEGEGLLILLRAADKAGFAEE